MGKLRDIFQLVSKVWKNPNVAPTRPRLQINAFFFSITLVPGFSPYPRLWLPAKAVRNATQYTPSASSLIEIGIDSSPKSTNMRDSSCQPDHDSPTRSTIPDSETAATDQRYPSSGHTPRQQEGDLYIIHDMIMDGQRIDTNSAIMDEHDIIKILDILVAKMSRHHPANMSGWDAASSDPVRQIILNGAENDWPQDLSFAMRRWKSLPSDALPWHCPELPSGTPGGGTDNHNRTGIDGNGLNKDDGIVDGVVDGDEGAGSNKASAGSETKEMEEKLAGAMAN